MSSLRISFIALSLALIAAATVVAGSKTMSKSMEKGASLTEKATFAGGCFWCMEEPFDKLPGVVSVTVGYIGGTVKNPTYKQVSAGRTGHTEAVQIVYDPSRFEYEKLLDIFWHNVDPTVINRQFCDTGSQYRTGVFYHSQRRLWKKPSLSGDRSSRRSHGRRSSTRQRSITSTTTRKTRFATSTTETDAVGTAGSGSSGERRPEDIERIAGCARQIRFTLSFLFS
jgi:peptide-methionine (S)-S-oxide reductase